MNENEYDGLHLCENCHDAYTFGRLCRLCSDQEQIDGGEAASVWLDRVPRYEFGEFNDWDEYGYEDDLDEGEWAYSEPFEAEDMRSLGRWTISAMLRWRIVHKWRRLVHKIRYLFDRAYRSHYDTTRLK